MTSITTEEYRALNMKGRNKYGAVRTEVNGQWFDSRAEARRYEELLLLEAGGLIENLELQPRFDLIVNGVKVGVYRGDFGYRDTETGEDICEDVKSAPTRTPVYKLKAKLVKALHGVEIVEVRA